ncbi:MAG: Maf family protein [Lachnospiraceae bacterium]|nr:Maf family protein [Lachnospiraceae bacterium]
MKYKRIILASKSPRRKEILEKCGFEPIVKESKCDESNIKEKNPEKLVEELSKLKAETVAETCIDGDVIVAADTVVAIEGIILGKPKTKKEAREMIRSYAGKTHTVYTGVTVIYKKKSGTTERTFADKAEVTVDEMTNCEIKAYVETGEPMDKAGAYGIQGAFCKYIPRINGDFYTVMGLPIARTYRCIKEMTR